MKLGFIAIVELVAMLSLTMLTQAPSEGHYEALESPVGEFHAESYIVTSPKIERRSHVDVAPITYFDVPLDEDLQDYIFMLCKENYIDPEIVIAMIWRESNFNPNCVGDNGNSLGLMQVQPRFHSERMERLGCTDLIDPYQNILVGVDFLSELMGRGEPIEWVLMAYNGGASYANRKAAAGEVSSYALRVLEKSESFETYERYLEVE
jgi:hypothetical protein